MKDKNRSSSYWKDIVFQASGNSTAQLIGIAGLPILTRLFTPEDFAEQAFFIQITTLLVALITFRYEYFVPLLKNDKESALLTKWIVKVGLTMVLIYTLLLAILHLFLASGLHGFGFKFNYYYYLAPITAFLISISVLFQHEAQRVGDYRLSGFSEVASKLFYILSGVLGSLLNAAFSLILTTAFGSIGKILSLRKYFLKLKSKTHESVSEIVKTFRSRAIGMVLANTLLTFSGLIPLYVIVNMYGSVAVGQFSLVMATIFLPSGVIGAAIGNVFYQRAGILWNNQDFKSLSVLWSRTIKKLLCIALPIYTAAFYLMPTIYPFVFGSAWFEAGVYAQIMTLAAFFSFIAGPVDRISIVVGFGYYLPLIHFIRFSLIVSFSFLCFLFKADIHSYVLGFSILMSFIYVSDVVFGRFFLFAKSLPK